VNFYDIHNKFYLLTYWRIRLKTSFLPAGLVSCHLAVEVFWEHGEGCDEAVQCVTVVERMSTVPRAVLGRLLQVCNRTLLWVRQGTEQADPGQTSVCGRLHSASGYTTRFTTVANSLTSQKLPVCLSVCLSVCLPVCLWPQILTINTCKLSSCMYTTTGIRSTVFCIWTNKLIDWLIDQIKN